MMAGFRCITNGRCCLQERYYRDTRLSACVLDENGFAKLLQVIERRFAAQAATAKNVHVRSSNAEESVWATAAEGLERTRRVPLPTSPRPWITYLLRHKNATSTEIQTTQDSELASGEVLALSIEASSPDVSSSIQVALGDWSRCRALAHVPHTTHNRLYIWSDNRDWMVATAELIEREIEPHSRRLYDWLRSWWIPPVIFIVVAVLLLARSRVWSADHSASLWLVNIILSVLMTAISYVLIRKSFPIFELSGIGLRSSSQQLRGAITFVVSVLASVGFSWLFELLLTR